eukprot:1158127-Pelagomonas_calceolata.AAC.16
MPVLESCVMKKKQSVLRKKAIKGLLLPNLHAIKDHVLQVQMRLSLAGEAVQTHRHVIPL